MSCDGSYCARACVQSAKFIHPLAPAEVTGQCFCFIDAAELWVQLYFSTFRSERFTSLARCARLWWCCCFRRRLRWPALSMHLAVSSTLTLADWFAAVVHVATVVLMRIVYFHLPHSHSIPVGRKDLFGKRPTLNGRAQCVSFPKLELRLFLLNCAG